MEARLERREFDLRYTVLRAPFGGVVSAVFAEVFEEVKAEQSVMRIIDPEKIEMIVNVPEALISLVPYAVDIKGATSCAKGWRAVIPQLPKGAGPSAVGDDFGDVYGLLLAVTGDGYSYAQLWGVQDRRIYLDANPAQLAQLGISETTLQRTMAQQHSVADAGSITLARQRVAVRHPASFYRRN